MPNEGGERAENPPVFRLGKKKSEVWKHISPTTSDIATCKICTKQLAYCRGSTSNLRKHLGTVHGIPTSNCVRRKPRDPSQIQDPNRPTVGTVPVHSGPKKRGRKPLYLKTGAPPPQTKYIPQTYTGPRKLSMDKLVAQMLCVDYQPPSFVEDAGFQELVNALNPSYAPPSRRNITHIILPQLLEEVVQRSQLMVNSVHFVCVTIDNWISHAADNVMAVSCQFVTKTLVMISLLLDVVIYNETDPAVALAEVLQNICQQWSLTNKVTCCVTDGTPNIMAAVRILGWEHLTCCIHSLNVIVQDALKEVGNLLWKVKAVVNFFHHSTLASDVLKTMQQQLGLKQRKLKNDDPSKWVTTYEMISVFVDHKSAITGCLGELNGLVELPTNEEWSVLSKLQEVLKPFLEASKELSSVNSVNISKVVPLSAALLRHTTQFSNNIYIPEQVTKVAKLLVSLMQQRGFSAVERNQILAASTILDPRFKKQVFSEEASVDNILQYIISLCPDDEPFKAELNSNTSGMSGSLWEEVDQKVAYSVAENGTTHPTTEISNEIKVYLREKHLPRNGDPLCWWREKSINFPKLSKIATKFLCVVPNAIPYERDVSMLHRRASLKNKHLKMLMFIGANNKVTMSVPQQNSV